jgi:hypothetical protein
MRWKRIFWDLCGNMARSIRQESEQILRPPLRRPGFSLSSKGFEMLSICGNTKVG